MQNFTPSNEAEIAEIIAIAISDKVPLEVIGGGSKRGLGEAVKAENILDLRNLSGIIDYQPQELILQVNSATSMHDINIALAEKNQILAFEPPDYSALFADGGKGGTIGGVVLCNLSGSRRPSSGAARDYLLGFGAVSGRGEIFKAGGNVVKNVTGFDLSKLMAGSYGTLAVAVSLNLKTHPMPASEQSLAFACKDIDSAKTLMQTAVNGKFTPSAVAYLPKNIAQQMPVKMQDNSLIVRFEGTIAGVKQALTELENSLPVSNMFEKADSQALWQAITNAKPFAYNKQHDYRLWRISIPPSEWTQFISACQNDIKSFDYFVNWGGGLIWLKENLNDFSGKHNKIRQITETLGGYAQKITENTKHKPTNSIPAFHPRPKAETELLKRIKKGFDPKTILNPNRMGF